MSGGAGPWLWLRIQMLGSPCLCVRWGAVRGPSAGTQVGRMLVWMQSRVRSRGKSGSISGSDPQGSLDPDPGWGGLDPDPGHLEGVAWIQVQNRLRAARIWIQVTVGVAWIQIRVIFAFLFHCATALVDGWRGGGGRGLVPGDSCLRRCWAMVGGGGRALKP